MPEPIDRRTVLLVGSAALVAAVVAACSPSSKVPAPTPSGTGVPAFPAGFAWGVATSA